MRAERGRLMTGVWAGGAACLSFWLAGCAHVPNQFREDGPSVTADWQSPTAKDVESRVSPAPPRNRGWQVRTVAEEDGTVIHWPLYFEDPFEDKGDGRTDETDPGNVHRLGWEDFVAFPYCFARYTGNWLMLPVSAIVTPPWTIMESDGRLSKQLLWYDHDAVPASRHEAPAAPAKPLPEPAMPAEQVSAEPAGPGV